MLALGKSHISNTSLSHGATRIIKESKYKSTRMPKEENTNDNSRKIEVDYKKML